MNSALLIFTILAIDIHIFIFYLETIAWVSALAQKTFGLTEQEAVQTKAMAANQGVYHSPASLGVFRKYSQPYFSECSIIVKDNHVKVYAYKILPS